MDSETRHQFDRLQSNLGCVFLLALATFVMVLVLGDRVTEVRQRIDVIEKNAPAPTAPK